MTKSIFWGIVTNKFINVSEGYAINEMYKLHFDWSDSFEEICLLSWSFSVRFQNLIIASSLFLIIQPGVSETSDQTKIYFISTLSCIFNAKDLIMLPQSALNLSFLVSLVTVDDNKDLVAVGNLINSHGSWFPLSFKSIRTSSYAVLASATMALLRSFSSNSR